MTSLQQKSTTEHTGGCGRRQAIVHVWIQPYLQGSAHGSVLIKKESFTMFQCDDNGRIEPAMIRDLIRTKYNVESDSCVEILTSDSAGLPSSSGTTANGSGEAPLSGNVAVILRRD